MSTHHQTGADPANQPIHVSGDLHPASAWQNAGTHNNDNPASFSADEALARLDAASEGLEEASDASLWTIWPVIAGGTIALSLFDAWVAVALFNVQPYDFPQAVPAAVTGVGNARPFALVSFNDRATMQEITRSLEAHGLEIEAGPLPGGAYRVTIPAEDGSTYDAIAAKLDKDPLVGRLVVGYRPPN